MYLFRNISALLCRSSNLDINNLKKRLFKTHGMFLSLILFILLLSCFFVSACVPATLEEYRNKDNEPTFRLPVRAFLNNSLDYNYSFDVKLIFDSYAPLEITDERTLEDRTFLNDYNGNGVTDIIYWGIDAAGILHLSKTILPDVYITVASGELKDDKEITQPWKEYRDEIAGVSVENIIAPYSTSLWFDQCNNPRFVSADLSKLDITHAHKISHTFKDSKYLRDINLSGWNISNMSDFYDDKEKTSTLFNNLPSLRSINVSNWALPNNISGMFANTTVSEIKGINTWNTIPVENMDYLFYNCVNLDSLNLSNWITFNLVSSVSTFENCMKIKTIDLSDWSMENIQHCNLMFSKDGFLREIIANNWNENFSNIDSKNMFQGCFSLKNYSNDKTNIESANYTDGGYFTEPTESDLVEGQTITSSKGGISSFDLYLPKDGIYTFTVEEIPIAYDKRIYIDDSKYQVVIQVKNGKATMMALSNKTSSQILDTTNAIIRFNNVYQGPSISIATLSDIPDMVVAPTNYLLHLNNFESTPLDANNDGLTDVIYWSIDKDKILHLGTHQIDDTTYGSGRFNGTDRFTYTSEGENTVPWLLLDTISPNEITQVSIDSILSPVDTAFWFYNLSSVETISVKNINSTSIERTSYMFGNATKLSKILGMENWNISHLYDMEGMFFNCSSLTMINLSNWHFADFANISHAFEGCNSLVNIYAGNWVEELPMIAESLFVFTECKMLPGYNADNVSGSQCKNIDLGGYFASPDTVDKGTFDNSPFPEEHIAVVDDIIVSTDEFGGAVIDLFETLETNGIYTFELSQIIPENADPFLYDTNTYEIVIEKNNSGLIHTLSIYNRTEDIELDPYLPIVFWNRI